MKDYQLQSVDCAIKLLLDQAGFDRPERINLETLCGFLGIKFKYTPASFSLTRTKNGETKIFVAKDTDYFEQRKQFAHEIGHTLRHGGVQLAATKEYEEYLDHQADNFAERLLVPTHLLAQLDFPDDMNAAVGIVAEIFDVDLDLAKKRLREYLDNLFVYEADEKLHEVLYKRFLYQYMGYYWRHDPQDSNIVYLYCRGKGFVRKLYIEGCYS
ncbi:ImmA/IrrE family metallo-endopeptidase [Ammoniphilus sp. YIM 78166]|uniref:ImmA/IrrE family metallo-endopeptidase n=1 Tax=Ammoniphilus sp. YIM 78166 TaxID=1644106 RepID=UPI00106F3ED0|nr:ImmA/IrrE family metallo-endopeptidase [Ammoniphilus sp. YIM 78166]